MKATTLLVCAVLATAVQTAPAAGGDPTLEELEAVVLGGEGGAEAWAALIKAYRFGITRTVKPIAQWALHTALARHPGDPRLLLQKAHLIAPHASYPILEELGRIPGWETRARRISELRHIGGTPEDGVLGDRDYTESGLWSRLLEDDLVSRALEFAEEGLRRLPGNRVLLARRALALALLGRDEEAMRDQEASGWLQVEGGRFAGIADAWICLGKPDLAFRSYGGRTPADGNARLVHAIVLARRGDLAGAEKLLRQDDPEQALLLLGLLLEQGRFDRAREIQDRVVDRVASKIGSNYISIVGPERGSREVPLVRAIRWLRARPASGPVRLGLDPRHLNWFVEADLPPDGRERLALERRTRNRHLPTDERIGILDREAELMKRLGQRSTPGPIHRKGVLLVEACRWEEGLSVLAAGALGPRDPREAPWDGRIDMAVEWGLAQSARDAEALAAAEPMGFIAVRRALASIDGVKDENRILAGPLSPPKDREIRELVSRGRGVLASVLAAYPRRTQGGAGCRPYLLAVVEQLGGPREVPFLLSEMRFYEAWIGEAREPPWDAVARSGAGAIDRCLARVTGLAPDAPDRATRREAWTAWWWAHAREVLGSR